MFLVIGLSRLATVVWESWAFKVERIFVVYKNALLNFFLVLKYKIIESKNIFKIKLPASRKVSSAVAGVPSQLPPGIGFKQDDLKAFLFFAFQLGMLEKRTVNAEGSNSL